MVFHIFKFTRINIVISAICFVLSKVSFLIAMILPWKILAVASGSGSAYFNYLNFFDGLDNKVQVAYLGAIVVAFFTLHLLLEFAFSYLVKKGADKAIEKNNKTGLFNNYRTFAKKIYRHYAVFFAASLYSILVFIWLIFLYPSLILGFVIYSVASSLLALAAFQLFKLSFEKVSGWLSTLYKIWWHLGFVFALIWAISDYWQGVMPDLLITFVSLLLYRQLLMMLTVVFDSGHLIYKNRVRAGQIFSSAPISEYQIKSELNIDFEQLIINLDQQKWLVEICKKEFPTLEINMLDKICHIVEAGNVAYIRVVPQGEEQADGLLIKIFNTNREALAEQEIVLLKSAKDGWPFMTLLYDKKVNGYLTLVCRWPSGSTWLQEPERVAIEPKLRNRLLAFDLPEDIVALYQRSQVGLYDRLKNVAWDHLQAYSGTAAEKINWDGLQVALQKILGDVAVLPSQLSLRPLSGRMTFGSKEDPRIANVTRWAWEPLGASWPLNRLKQLDLALTEAAKQRPELEGADPEKAKLVARLYEFERRYQNKNYAGAVNVLSNLLNHFEEMQAKKMQYKEKIES